MNIPEPKYNNKEVLIHCMKREPHSLIFDEGFINYDEKTVNNLCDDLEKNHEYLTKLFKKTPLLFTSLRENALPKIKEREEMEMALFIANSLVWAAIFYHHAEKLNDKNKKYLEE